MNNWYTKHKQLIASNKLPFSNAIVAAVMMVMNGLTIEVAAEANNVPVKQVEEALQTEKQKPIEPIEPVKPISKPIPVGNSTIVNAIIKLENASETFVGPAQDTGVMQMLPATWEEINNIYFNGKYPYSKYRFNRQIQVLMGEKFVQHIKQWLQSHEEMWDDKDEVFLVFATYNGGFGNITNSAFSPDIIKKNLPRTFSYAKRGCNLVGQDYVL